MVTLPHLPSDEKGRGQDATRLESLEGKSRSVLADRSIREGEVIDASWAIELSKSELAFYMRSSLFPYIFVRSTNDANIERVGYICLGIVSFCNHSDLPNAYVRWINETICMRVELVASRFIERNEEVTIYYSNLTDYEGWETFF